MPQRKASSDQQAQDKLRSSGEIPEHIAIIMDGNGRWAKRRGLPRVAGHKEGINSVRDIVEACGQLGVKYLTLYTFSTENWKRPQEEVSVLMKLLVHSLRNERDQLHKNKVRLKAIGDIKQLPPTVLHELNDALKLTENNTGLTLILALSYSGRWDILNAVRLLMPKVRNGEITEQNVTEKIFEQYLSTDGIPEPDLLIRTSGEMRISNFLLWQLAYSEIYIAKEYWPSFRRMQLYEAIADYQKRERRFGMVSEQLKPQHQTSHRSM
ncbi:MAG TPA: isoprenyl transferase [Bacteroidota bacterium]|nr:isoprenyl transferase [Bacteroidota bacterium]